MIRSISRSSFRLNPIFDSNLIESSPNLLAELSCQTCVCRGSAQSYEKKENRYGPEIGVVGILIPF